MTDQNNPAARSIESQPTCDAVIYKPLSEDVFARVYGLPAAQSLADGLAPNERYHDPELTMQKGQE